MPERRPEHDIVLVSPQRGAQRIIVQSYLRDFFVARACGRAVDRIADLCVQPRIADAEIERRPVGKIKISRELDRK